MQRMVETADIQQRGQSTLFPLMALMKAQGTLAGRKALLFFSEGLPIPPSLEEAYRSRDQRSESGECQCLCGGRTRSRYQSIAGTVPPDARSLRT